VKAEVLADGKVFMQPTAQAAPAVQAPAVDSDASSMLQVLSSSKASKSSAAADEDALSDEELYEKYCNFDFNSTAPDEYFLEHLRGQRHVVDMSGSDNVKFRFCVKDFNLAPVMEQFDSGVPLKEAADKWQKDYLGNQAPKKAAQTDTGERIVRPASFMTIDCRKDNMLIMSAWWKRTDGGWEENTARLLGLGDANPDNPTDVDKKCAGQTSFCARPWHQILNVNQTKELESVRVSYICFPDNHDQMPLMSTALYGDQAGQKLKFSCPIQDACSLSWGSCAPEPMLTLYSANCGPESTQDLTGLSINTCRRAVKNDEAAGTATTEEAGSTPNECNLPISGYTPGDSVDVAGCRRRYSLGIFKCNMPMGTARVIQSVRSDFAQPKLLDRALPGFSQFVSTEIARCTFGKGNDAKLSSKDMDSPHRWCCLYGTLYTDMEPVACPAKVDGSGNPTNVADTTKMGERMLEQKGIEHGTEILGYFSKVGGNECPAALDLHEQLDDETLGCTATKTKVQQAPDLELPSDSV